MEWQSKRIATYLKEKRVSSGLSQARVGELLGYSSPQFVSNWERGKCSPPTKSLNKLIKIYDIDAEEFIQLVLDEEEGALRKLLRKSGSRKKV